MSVRRSLYRLASLLGDVQAVTSGNPKRVVKRLVNKTVGRKVVRRLWWR
ncbi:MAG: hypothetical protein M3133_03705 [Actinomycetota bacterium]|nr:hypothetical protein [Actinomycetota bacterium]